MRIVSIDTSEGTSVSAYSVTSESQPLQLQLLAHSEQPDPRRHAEALGSMLAEVLAQVDEPLGAVVGGCGPAPFTGLRAGLVAARTLARTRGVPMWGVPSLDGVARLALDDCARRGQADAHILVVTDARRSEVYAAAYRARGEHDVERLSDLSVLSPGDTQALAALGQVHAVAGSGLRLYPQIASDLGAEALSLHQAGSADAQVRIALSRHARGEELSSEPLYLRHADVQMPAARKRASGRN